MRRRKKSWVHLSQKLLFLMQNRSKNRLYRQYYRQPCPKRGSSVWSVEIFNRQRLRSTPLAAQAHQQPRVDLAKRSWQIKRQGS